MYAPVGFDSKMLLGGITYRNFFIEVSTIFLDGSFDGFHS